MATRILIRRDSLSNWNANNPVLSEGELGIDLTNKKIKIGNGIDSWTALSYLAEIANQSEAQTGEINNKYMTPLRTAEAISSQLSQQISDGGFITETDFDNLIDDIGGAGLSWNVTSKVYDLDFASLTEAQDINENEKVLTPFNAQNITIDGGEF